jgi:hypothetical protein
VGISEIQFLIASGIGLFRLLHHARPAPSI